MIRKIFKRLFRLFLRILGLEKPSKKTKKPPFEKRFKRNSLKNVYDAVDFLRKIQVDDFNSTVEQRIACDIAEGSGVINVGFLVNERAKWSCQNLLDEFNADERFRTRIYLSMLNRSQYDSDDRKDIYLTERKFFLGVDKHLVDLYDWENDNILPVEEIDVDILFFQQPWGMLDFPMRMVGKTLCAYIHYGLPLLANEVMHYNIGSFHSYIWKFFVQTEGHRLLHIKHDPFIFNKLVVTGYPKLDIYFDDFSESSCELWKSNSLKKIIFAPHHSIGQKSIRISTFTWSGKQMLSLAKTLSELQWVYKPHPRLCYSVVDSKIMNEREYKDYEQSWANLPNASVYDSGAYFDIFKTSDALITDCGSFLAEYLPTKKPIIWLVSEEHIGFNSVGDRLTGCYYRATNMKELQDLIQSVIIDGNDPLLEKRIEMIDLLFPKRRRAATEIVQYIKSHFNLN